MLPAQPPEHLATPISSPLWGPDSLLRVPPAGTCLTSWVWAQGLPAQGTPLGCRSSGFHRLTPTLRKELSWFCGGVLASGTPVTEDVMALLFQGRPSAQKCLSVRGSRGAWGSATLCMQRLVGGGGVNIWFLPHPTLLSLHPGASTPPTAAPRT